MLNAFRHHGPRRRHRRGPVRPSVAVLNAFRHHGPRRTEQWRDPDAMQTMCSTPSGITARDGQEPLLSAPGSQLCSTPSGITARDGTGGASSASSPCCAQRLPASRPATALSFLLSQRLRPCAQRLPASRPATVGDIPRSAGKSSVLNAFRHQGPRRRSIRASRRPSASCAQRLPASRPATGALAALAGVHTSRCSTPSGITARDGRDVAGALRSRGAVLNAFRHHGPRRSTSSDSATLSARVLNAFRHHGPRRNGATS